MAERREENKKIVRLAEVFFSFSISGGVPGVYMLFFPIAGPFRFCFFPRGAGASASESK